MADVIVACTRSGSQAGAAERLRNAALRLAPPELPAREPLLFESAEVVAAVANPTEEGVWLHDGREGATVRGAVCVGGLFGTPGAWWRPGSEAPDGTYGLARWDARTVELVADICATRTLWYTLSEDGFFASTSQRALVTLLGGFDLLPEAVACFLSTGTLGPDASWDARIRRVPPDARAVLDRASWRVSVHESAGRPTPLAGDDRAQVARLRDAIAVTCGSLNVDLERWVLALSGGCDSRALLAFLVQNGLRPRCVTWTTRASLRKPLSDASIARLLCRRYHVEHELLFLDDGPDLDTSVSRFVAADEGRNDEIAGYLDGFALWRSLVVTGTEGLIRGDESFGPRSRPMAAESGRRQVGGATPADYPESHLLRSLGLVEPTWPKRLRRTEGEDLRDYRARISQQGFVPIVLAGLNGPKARYLEIVNPLLSRVVMGAVRSLPTEMREYSRAFGKIVDGLDPTVPYARSSSTRSPSDLFASPEFADVVVRELTSGDIERVLPGDAALRVLASLTVPRAGATGPKARAKALLKRAGVALPIRLTDRIYPRYSGPNRLSPAKLAWRALLANRTISLLEDDARALARSGGAIALPGPGSPIAPL
ncbi:MAG TPA: hypothetical protein VFH61_17255 [Thermoleophilia bacterium]|nr:hypothetical protein [Thermoleophilia bacterium]